MNVVDWFTVSLLAAGIGIELLSCLGLVVMKNVFTKLHFVTPASVLGPIPIVAAILIHESFSEPGIKTLLALLLLVAVNPVLTHATARAARLRQSTSEEDLI